MERKNDVVAMPSRSRGSSTGSRWASSRAEEGLQSEKKSSSMLVQAQAGESQAARGFWGGPGKNKSKMAAGSWRGAALAVGGPLAELKRAWMSEKNRLQC
jgi:hypothetical protein